MAFEDAPPSIRRRQTALRRQLQRRGIRDERVLDAIENTRRDLFVPEWLQDRAYEDNALPIACDQTISQPYIVALMTESLQLTGSETVLEVGTGSGYQAAILASLCANVVTIERLESLSLAAQHVLTRLGFENIQYHVGDGTLGVADQAPYDGILVTAGTPEVPDALYEQLKPGGYLTIPVGDASIQSLNRITRHQPPIIDGLCGCRFVKLIGEQGWPSD